MNPKNKGKDVVVECRPDDILSRTIVAWQASRADSVKINVDASYVAYCASTSVGVVGRDCIGDVIISSWEYIGYCSNVEEAELPACLTELYIGMTFHNPIILKTDCSFVHAFLANELLDRPLLLISRKKR